MRSKTHLWKRSLAAFLSFVMLLGMVPALGIAPLAYAADGDTTTDDGTTNADSTGSENENQGQQTNITGDYITLPITIRDFAADGMLFEFNELNETTFTRADDGTITWGTPTEYTKTDRLYTYDHDSDEVIEPYTAVYNPTYWDLDSTDGSQTWEDGELVADYTGIRIYPAGAELFETTDETKVSGANWYCLIADADGNIVKVLDRKADKTNIAEIMTEVGGAYSVWSWRGASNVPYYSVLAKVTEENKDQYRFGFYDTTNSTLTAGDMGYFYLGQKYNTVSDHASLYVTSGSNITIASYDHWERIVCDSNGQVVAVIPVGNTDDYSTYQSTSYTVILASEYYQKVLDSISHITEDNMSEYQIVTPTCDVGGALFIERTINVNEANTKGFGLLYTLDSDYLHWLAEDNEAENLPNTTYYEYNYNYTTLPTAVNLWDKDGNVYASQDLYGAGIRTNLVTKELDPITGKPLYTETTVAFLAKYMEQIMAVPEIGDNGAYNMHHVMGVKLYDEYQQYVGPNSPLSVYDLADIFRMNVNGGLGDYDTSKEKFDSRALLYPHQATTWYDAAYYLLHMLWNDSPVDLRTGTEGQDGYGMPIANYNRIHLVKATNADGEECYVFNAKYDGTTYDFKNGEIFNSHFGENETTETREYTVACTRDGAEDGAYSNPMPVNRFDPLGPSGAGVNRGYTMSGDTYGDFAVDSEMVRSEYYDETNYNMTLEGHAQFVYHEDSNQYFTFTGDDDVYLYINGIRVLDVGGAHSISKVSIDLNDVAAEIGLKDGGTYRFDFFYTERHGTAANFGIETNIQIADASMNTTKTGYQGGVNTGYGGPVNKDTHVGYSFELKNDGTAKIHNLTFQDDQIGVYFGYDRLQYYPTTYPEDYPEDKKMLYTIDDLYLIFWNSEGQMTEFIAPGSLTEEDLMKYLANGLEPGEHIGIYGFKYFIPESQWVTNYVLDENGEPTTEVLDISFTNTVYTSANTSSDNKGTPLHGVADWKVVQMEVPYTAFHVYDWVHKNVSNDPEANTDWQSTGVTVPWDDLKDYLANEIADGDITQDMLNQAEIVLCTGSGNEEAHNQNSNVSTNGRDITYTSTTPGKDTVFFKFKNMAEKYNDLVFSYEVYTYGVTDNVYVLDYGLSVELAGQDFGFQNNDILTNNYNTNPVRITATVVNPTSNYGSFTHTSAVDEDENTSISSLKYTPNEIINDIDTVQVKIEIVETQTVDGETTVKERTKYTGVEMLQTITTAPANVVYYEENHPGITYCSSTPKLNTNSAGYLMDISYKLIYTTSEQIVTADEDGFLYDAEGNNIQDKDMQLVMVDEEDNLVDEAGDPIADTSIKLKRDDDDNLILVTLLKRVKVDDNGYLVDEAGNNILDVNGQKVLVDEEANLVDADGNEVEVANLSGLPVMVSNQWVQYETVVEKTDANGDPVLDEDGNPIYESVAGTNQSADQDMNYGYDPNYTADKEGQWNENLTVIGSTTFELDVNDVDALQTAGIAALNDYLGLTGTDSNGTVKELVVNETAEVMYFDFVGTGFEIVSRTTDEQYAVIDVRVYLWDNEKDQPKINMEGTEGYDETLPETNSLGIVRRKPVVTESKGGDLYQVPIISITGLDKANYRVSVWAGTTGNVQRVLYIDGIRIYGPLEGDSAALDYYNPEEYEAEFFEVKALIQNGQAIYADASTTDDDLKLVTGTTMVEDTEEGGVLVALEGEENVSQYMTVGPNNELYLDPTNFSMIAFFITPDADYHGGERTLEIGAHRKADATIYDNGNIYMAYGSTAQDIIDGKNMHTISSGTEMYYTIDVEKLVKDEETGKYLVMIGANSSDLLTTLALTSIKVAGYDITFAEAALLSADSEGDVFSTPIAAETFTLLRTFRAPVEEEPEVVQIPVNENLNINSAKLRATQIVSGRTATVTVKADKAAQTIVITDADGNVVETDKVIRKVSGSVATFTVIWKVYGSRGDKLEYTIRVYDKDVLASVNMETVTVTIK